MKQNLTFLILSQIYVSCIYNWVDNLNNNKNEIKFTQINIQAHYNYIIPSYKLPLQNATEIIKYDSKHN